jgi:hypothetical protein
MRPAAGPILRRVGLVIELPCVLALVFGDVEGRSVAGIAARQLLIAGVALGFVLWSIGVTLVLWHGRRSRSL